MALILQAPEPRLGARILSIAEVCDAVAAVLNASTLSLPAVAVREYLPRFDLADLGDRIKLSVTPGETFITTRSARGAWQRDLAVRVTAIATLGEDPYEERIDELMGFVEQVRSALEAVALPDSETWKGQPRRAPLVAVSIEADPILDAAMLEQMRQFTSAIVVTYRVTD
jgi:hypothetical protein